MGSRRCVSIGVAAIFTLLAACGGDEAASPTTSTDAQQGETTIAPTITAGDGAASPAPTTEPVNSAAPPTTGADEPCAAGTARDSLTMGTGSFILGVDPIVALGSGSAGASELTAIYDTLMRYLPDSGTYEPRLAESLTSNDDLTEWTLVLRDGITFGNGDPVTSDAVIFSIQRLAASARASAGLAQEITGFEAIDDHTLVLTTRAPNGTVPYVLSTEAGMVVNPALVEERGDGFASNPLGAGAGAFEFERLVPGEELILVAKDDYWGGEVCLAELRFVTNTGGRATWDGVRSGDLDVAFIRDMSVITEARAQGYEVHSQIAGGDGLMMMNNRPESATSDPLLRKAISLAIDPAIVNDRALNGLGRPTTCLAHPDQSISPGIDCPEYDPVAAATLVKELKASGWSGTLNLTYQNDPLATEVSLAVEAMLINVGIAVTRENLPREMWNERVLAPPYNFEVAQNGLALLDSSPIARLNQFGSDSGRNRIGYASAEMDAALDQLSLAITREENVEAMRVIQEIWNADIPSHVLYASEWFVAADSDVSGLEFTRDVTVLFEHAFIEG